ncbi:MAG: lipoate--protein ligase family protein [Euryarchaeota archaeon]|nr:lipoate--protein ligase family protein [Euryarchaeota archaeon]
MRLIVDDARSGADNMARDQELLAAAEPVVRLYAWRPACVSLGYAQPEADIDVDATRAAGIDVVRRPTGGGAILHEEDEVTYCVVLPRGMGPPDLFGSYRFIAGGVVETLRDLGLDASFVEGHTGRDPLCYLREEGVSVAVGGRKISGGAQKRTKQAILQHGTILLSRRTELLSRIFRVDARRVEENVACLHDFRPGLRREDVLAAAKTGFVRALSKELVA